MRTKNAMQKLSEDFVARGIQKRGPGGDFVLVIVLLLMIARLSASTSAMTSKCTAFMVVGAA